MNNFIAINENRTKYEGFLEVKGEFFHLFLDQSQPIRRIYCEWKLHHRVRKHLNLLHQRFNECNDSNQFLNELKSIVENSDEKKVQEVWKPAFYDVILNHLQELGWDKVVTINDDFTKLQLKASDAEEREHFLIVSLTSQYPHAIPDVSTSLPVPFNLLWTKDSDLVSVYSQFKATLHQFERLWHEVDELKQCTWILEPENPNFAATSFRLALGNSCSIQVNVNPLNMGVVPECHFLGADWAISPLRDRFQNFEEWNEAQSLYQNLKRILDIDFPARQGSGSQDMTLQCGICYAFRLDVEIPDQICNDRRCGQAFHHQCLLEWIKSIPGAKQSFNVLFGECPYCTNPIKLNILPS